jgi:hypothetical protein
MSNTNTGGPAFPLQSIGPDFAPGYSGMTLRDYFAAKALPASYTDTCERARVDGWPEGWRDEVAAEAYEMADAMLKAREP